MGAALIDVPAARADTPACLDHAFLDSAGSSLPPTPVQDVELAHLHRESRIGGYLAAAERAEDLDRGYRVFAQLLDCAPDEVAFTDSATRSWLSLIDSVPLAAGDRVLIGHMEYGAHAVALLRLAEEAGFAVEVIPSDEAGALSVSALRDMLDGRVKLVSLVHVPTNTGLVNPVREVVDAAHSVGALVLLDACQSVGQLSVHAAELGVDMLTGTGRKWLRGPRGTGFLVVRKAIAHRLRQRLVDHIGAPWTSPTTYRLRSDARSYELFEYDVAARLALIEAAEYTLRLGIDDIAARVGELADRARAGLAEIPGVRLWDLGRRRCGIVTFTVDGVPPADVRDMLRKRGVTVSVSPTRTSMLDMPARGLADGVVRASPHYFVSDDDIDLLVAEVAALAALTGLPGSRPS